MGVADWMRVLDTVSGLVQMTGRFRRGPDSEVPAAVEPGAGPLGQLETRLAGVVVAALKEAFDRDRARMDLERSQMEAERQRAEALLRAELRRQIADRALSQLRLVAVMAIGIWMLSAVLAVWLPGTRAIAPRVLMGAGWVCAFAALGGAFVAWQRVSAWSAGLRDSTAPVPDGVAVADTLSHPAVTAAPWLLLCSLGLVAASLLVAL
jgi:hypothetical protein